MRPDIEQLLTTLRGKKGTHIPLMELGIHPKIKARLLGRDINTLKDDIAFWHKAGYDYIKIQPQADFQIPGHILDESQIQERSWAPEGRGQVGSWREFDAFDFTRPEDIDYSRFEQVTGLLPDGLGVIGQYGDIFTMVWELMGFEGFSYALFEDPRLVEALFDKIGSAVLPMYEYFAQNDSIDAMWYSDDIAYQTGLMIGPQDLNKYLFPWLRKIGDLARESGKPFIYHSDGVLWDVMEDLIGCGVTALHPIEPKAMDIVEVKQRYGDRLCLIGNLDVGDILSMGTPEMVRQKVEETIRQVGQTGGYCVGSGNSIPDYVKFENYTAMLDIVKSRY